MEQQSCYGPAYDRYIQHADDSKSNKIKKAFWTTKQAMIKKFGRKQDEHIVASDSDLDSKLQLFKSVQTTCRDLSIIIDKYQSKICYLSQAENEMGRFLKQHSIEDKTRAGKMMMAVGKALSNSAQQRLTLRAPLGRVQQEVRTFRQRGISDTLSTIRRMETSRTDYRGALLWMKNVSEELDPDTYKQLEKFRCVQAQVRQAKGTFDRLKVDSMQKIDLLAASRCNMLSHVLAAYQNTLLCFLEKTCHTMVAVADSFKGYQYYEFSILKQLTPEVRKLAGDDGQDESDSRPVDAPSSGKQETPGQYGELISPNGETEADLDKRLDAIFQADDAVMNAETSKVDWPSLFSSDPSDSMPQGDSGAHASELGDLLAGSAAVPPEHRDFLADLFDTPTDHKQAAIKPSALAKVKQCDPLNALSGGQGDSSKWNTLRSECTGLEAEWDSVLGRSRGAGVQSLSSSSTLQTTHLFPDDHTQTNEFGVSASTLLPSRLLSADRAQSSVAPPSGASMAGDSSSGLTLTSLQPADKATNPARLSPSTANTNQVAASQRSGQKPTSLDAWMNLFADLGPMANPDAISKKAGQISDA